MNIKQRRTSNEIVLISSSDFLPKYNNRNNRRRIIYIPALLSKKSLSGPQSSKRLCSFYTEFGFVSKSSNFGNWLKSGLVAKMLHFLQNKNQHTFKKWLKINYIARCCKRFNKKMKSLVMCNSHTIPLIGEFVRISPALYKTFLQLRIKQ